MLSRHILYIVALSLAWHPTAWAFELSPQVQSQISKRLVPAYFQGNSAASLALIAPLIAKLDEQQLNEIDVILTEQGVPDLGSLLLELRLKTMLHSGKVPPPHPREASLALPVLRDEIEHILSEVEGQEWQGDELPDFDTLKAYEDAFWEIHVASNQLRNAAKMAAYGAASVDGALQVNLKSLSDDQLNALDIDFEALGDEIQRAADELRELKVELRVRAVTKAASVLKESTDFRERLRAAYIVDFDGRQVIEFLRSDGHAQFTRPRLHEENLLDTMETLVRQARESAGDLVTKSRLLYLGMHWWMRGRYGLGPDGFGLLKSVSALSSPLAQFPLYMPAKPPIPTDPADSSYQIPKFDRRHHYIWMYEYRTVQKETETRSNSEHDRAITSRTKLSGFY